MKVTVVDSATNKRHSVRLDASNHGTIDTCPQCGASPCPVAGTGITHHDYDTYYAPAIAKCCNTRLGQLEAKVDTFFGIKEDESVLHGRPRVYGRDS